MDVPLPRCGFSEEYPGISLGDQAQCAYVGKRFFSKALAASCTSTHRVIAVGKNAAYPKAFKKLKTEGFMLDSCKLQQSKYLNNLIEQDHRYMKRLVKLGIGFFLFDTA